MPNQTKAKTIALKGVWLLLRQSWQLYRAAFGLLIGYAAWILLPYVGVVVLAMLYTPEQIFSDYMAIYIILIMIQAVIIIWASNAIMLTINGIAGNEKLDSTEINQKSWQLIIPLLIVAVIETLIVLGGFILLVIPGIIFAVWFTFAQTAVVLDGKQGVAALSYSRSLVIGRFWSIMRLIILGPFIIFLAYLVIISLLVSLGLLLSGNTEMIMNEAQIPMWPDIIENIVNVFTLPLFLAYWTILYRNVKETKVCSSNPSSDLKSTSN